MCQLDPNQLESLVNQSCADSGALVMASSQGVTNGSRRRRLWELGDHAHCPVIGVGVPIAVLRRLVDKVAGGKALADDYDLHCGAIASCKLRTPLAEAVQRELDRRYMVSLRQAAKLKTTEDLAAWWKASSLENFAGVFWATLTHARCTPALEHGVLGKVHMVQHQVGAAVRADLQRFESLIDENAVLTRALAEAQRRNTSQAEAHAKRIDVLQRQMVQLRADLIGRDTALAASKDELRALEAAIPGLKTRSELARQGEHHIERIHQLERALLQSQQEAERQRRHAEAVVEKLRSQAVATQDGPDVTEGGEASPKLHDRAVLCVGGRQASVPVYRQLIEHAGGRFLHHDGGEEESSAKLDATLAAADLVICQTGCISHGAYWRVKEHCKRTGKRCVFVENPSASSLARGLARMVSIRSEPMTGDVDKVDKDGAHVECVRGQVEHLR